MTKLSATEGFRQFQELKRHAKAAADKREQEFFSTFGLQANDPDIKGIVSEIRERLKLQKLLEQNLLRSLQENKLDTKTAEDMNKIFQNIQFYITCAYMKKQDTYMKKQETVNANLLLLNKMVVLLTSLVILLTLFQVTSTKVDIWVALTIGGLTMTTLILIIFSNTPVLRWLFKA